MMERTPAGSSRKSSVARAVHELGERIGSGEWSESGVLPSLTNLAALLGISRGSAWKVVAALKRDGLLEAVEGGRIRLAGLRRGLLSSVSERPRWRKLAREMTRDILSGKGFDYGKMPTMLELQARYRVCYQTMRKAMAVLQESGQISQILQIRSAPSKTVRTYRPSIAFIASPSDSSGVIGAVYRERRVRFFEHLEREAAKGGVRILFETFDPSKADAANATIRRIMADRSLAGYIVHPAWAGGGLYGTNLLDPLSRLNRDKKPVAILDHSWEFPVDKIPRERRIRIFRTAGPMAGRTVGNELLSLGHRCIAYFSAWHRFGWSVQRLEGLRNAFSIGPHGCRLLNFTIPDLGAPFDIVLQALRAGVPPGNKEADLNLLRNLPAPRQLREQVEALFKQALPAYPSGSLSGIEKSLLDFIAAYRSLIPSGRSPMSLQARSALIDLLDRQLDDAACLPLFDAAMEQKSLTAWVFSSDSTALRALDYLKRKGREIPKDLSVVSFDNTPESLDCSLTSYDFNMAGFARQAIAFAFKAESPFAERSGSVEVEGALIRRGSLGRVRT